jgi:hypothetical protein
MREVNQVSHVRILWLFRTLLGHDLVSQGFVYRSEQLGQCPDQTTTSCTVRTGELQEADHSALAAFPSVSLRDLNVLLS